MTDSQTLHQSQTLPWPTIKSFQDLILDHDIYFEFVSMGSRPRLTAPWSRAGALHPSPLNHASLESQVIQKETNLTSQRSEHVLQKAGAHTPEGEVQAWADRAEARRVIYTAKGTGYLASVCLGSVRRNMPAMRRENTDSDTLPPVHKSWRLQGQAFIPTACKEPVCGQHHSLGRAMQLQVTSVLKPR